MDEAQRTTMTPAEVADRNADLADEVLAAARELRTAVQGLERVFEQLAKENDTATVAELQATEAKERETLFLREYATFQRASRVAKRSDRPKEALALAFKEFRSAVRVLGYDFGPSAKEQGA